MSDDVKTPPPSDFEGWLATTWQGTAQPPFFAIHFTHPARVRQAGDGSIEAEWFDNDPRSAYRQKNVWRRFVQPHLAAKLYEQVTGEVQE